MELETVSMLVLNGKKMCNRSEVDRGGIHSSFWRLMSTCQILAPMDRHTDNTGLAKIYCKVVGL